MATFDPGALSEPTMFRFCCSGPGGTTYSTPFTVTPSADCGTLACQISQPLTGVSGPAGTPVNLGGLATGAVVYQSAPSPSGPWATATPPTSIQAGSGSTYWRMCCVDSPTTCSPVVIVAETAGVARLTRSDADGVLQSVSGETVTEQYCLEDCPTPTTYRWEIRVDPPVDPDGFVTSTNWQPITAFDSMQCVDLYIRAEDIDPLVQDTRTGLSDLDHNFIYYLRGSCDGGASWLPEVQATIVYDHIDDGSI